MCVLDLYLSIQVETMFEKYNFAGVFIQIQAVLTLYAQGACGDNWRFTFYWLTFCLYNALENWQTAFWILENSCIISLFWLKNEDGSFIPFLFVLLLVDVLQQLYEFYRFTDRISNWLWWWRNSCGKLLKNLFYTVSGLRTASLLR